MHGPYDEFPCFHSADCHCENCRKEGKNGYHGNIVNKRKQIKTEIARLENELKKLEEY